MIFCPSARNAHTLRQRPSEQARGKIEIHGGNAHSPDLQSCVFACLCAPIRLPVCLSVCVRRAANADAAKPLSVRVDSPSSVCLCVCVRVCVSRRLCRDPFRCCCACECVADALRLSTPIVSNNLQQAELITRTHGQLTCSQSVTQKETRLADDARITSYGTWKKVRRA